MSLLKQNRRKKNRVIIKLKCEVVNNKKYLVKRFWNLTIYKKKLENGHLLGHYYLIL